MTDNNHDHDLDQWYRRRRAEQAFDRLAADYRAEGEQVDELELLRRLTRTGQQPGHVRSGQPDGTEAIEGLVLYAALADEIYRLQLHLIKAALANGMKFREIGAALGITDDGARARWRTGRHLIEPDTTEGSTE